MARQSRGGAAANREPPEVRRIVAMGGGGFSLNGVAVHDDAGGAQTLHKESLMAWRVLGFALVAGLMVLAALLLSARPRGTLPPGATSLALAVEDPATPRPSGAVWACRMANAGPVRVARDNGELIFMSLDGRAQVPLVWPRGFSARLVNRRAELVARDGSVLAREGDVLNKLGGGLGAVGDAFHVCTVGGKIYDPIP